MAAEPRAERPASPAGTGRPAPASAPEGAAGPAPAPAPGAAPPGGATPGPLASPPAPGVEDERPGIIKDIAVRGNRKVEADAVLAVVRSKTGTPVNTKQIADDIRAIWELGFFDDIRAELVQGTHGLMLLFSVTERALVQQIQLHGNDELDEEEILKVVDIKAFGILNISQIRKNQQKILDLYYEKGFFLTDVRWRVEDAPGNFKILHFDIDEHAKVMVKRVTFLGNKQIPDEELKWIIQTREGGYWSWATESGTFRSERWDQDQQFLEMYYIDNGFINVKIGKPRVSISPDKRFMYLTVYIEEGEQYRVGALQFHSANPDGSDLLYPSDDLARVMKLREGDIFNRSQLNEDLHKRVSDVYRNRGYAYVNISPDTNVDPDRRLIHFNFRVEKGPLVYYERVRVIGNLSTRDLVIRREMDVYEGDLSSAARMEASRKRIERLGYFEKVEVKTKKGSDETKMIVDFEVTEKSTGQFNIGAGFSSLDSFVANATIRKENLFGRGQSLALSALFSGTRRMYDLTFSDPHIFDSDLYFSDRVFREEVDRFQYLRTATGNTLQLLYWLDDANEWLFGPLYRIENVSIEQTSSSQIRLKNLYRDGLTSSLGLSLSRDLRNNRLSPTDGSYHLVDVRFADSVLGSTNVFTKVTGRSQFFFPLAFDSVFKIAGNISWITSRAAAGIPIFERIYAGGPTSVRGYQWSSISPTLLIPGETRDPATPLVPFSYGGNKGLWFNVEWEYPIFQQIGINGVFFFDAGNAYAEDESYFQDKGDKTPFGGRINTPPLGLYKSWGFGFRWYSPIGPLRFEWGLPMDRRRDPMAPDFEFDDAIKFDFNFGTVFQ